MKQLIYKLPVLLMATLVAVSCAQEPKESSTDWELLQLEAFLATNAPEAKKLENDVYLLASRTGSSTGNTPASVDSLYIAIDYSIKDRHNTTYTQTKKETAQLLGTYTQDKHYTPLVILYNNFTSMPGVAQVLRDMHTGDSVSLLMPSWMAGNPLGNNEPVIIDVILHKVLTETEIRSEEAAIVKQYIETHNTTDPIKFIPVTDSTGQILENIYHRVLDAPTASDSTPIPTKDMKMKLKYAGYYAIDQFLLDTNIEAIAKEQWGASNTDSYMDYVFQADNPGMIAAFDAALRNVRVGSKVEFIFTSEWGYSTTGNHDKYDKRHVYPFNPLRFYVETYYVKP